MKLKRVPSSNIFFLLSVPGLTPQSQCVLTCKHRFYPVTGEIRTALCNVQTWPKHICSVLMLQRRWVLLWILVCVFHLTSVDYLQKFKLYLLILTNLMRKKKVYLKMYTLITFCRPSATAFRPKQQQNYVILEYNNIILYGPLKSKVLDRFMS